jgi:hypothetical protein
MVRRGWTGAALVMALCAVPVGLGACGGGTGDGSDRGAASPDPTVATETWARGLDAACSGLNREYQRLATADPVDRSDAVDYAEQVDSFAREFARVVADAGVPASDEAAAADLGALAEDFAGAADELFRAAGEGELAAVDAATDEIARLGDELNDAADSLDVPACGGF